MVACISTNIFTLIELIIGVQVLFSWFTYLLILVNHIVSIILGVNASSSFDHRKSLSMKLLLSMKILV